MNEHWMHNEHEEHEAGCRVGTLLREATRPVDAGEVVALVRGGAARGRRLRRRRQGATVLAAAAVVGVVGGVGLVSGPGATPAPDQAPAAQGREPAATPEPAPDARPDAGRRLQPVRATALADAVESVLGADVRTVMTEDRLRGGGPIADLTWNGFAMRVFVRPAVTEGDGATRCAIEGSGRCVPVDEGAADRLTWTGPAAEGGVTGTSVTVFDDRGWDVGITVFNAADGKRGPLLADQPPLSAEQLTRAVLTGTWFRQSGQRRG